jgi:Protein of unknown function (DUF2975)
MEIKTRTRTEQILTVMRIVAWVAFIGLLIQAGALIISYAVSGFNPDAAKNLYQGLNLFKLRQFNFYYYTMSVSFIVGLTVMKAYIAGLVIKILSKVNLTNPFTADVANRLESMSHLLLGTWVVSMLHDVHNKWLSKRIGSFDGDWNAGEFIFIAGIVFVIAQIFKRGVELQSENELTV